MQNGPPSGADSVTPGVSMSVVLLENRKTEPKNLGVTSPASIRRGWHRPHHVLYAAYKQVIFVAKMCVER
jgi:hypothetical protein